MTFSYSFKLVIGITEIAYIICYIIHYACYTLYLIQCIIPSIIGSGSA